MPKPEQSTPEWSKIVDVVNLPEDGKTFSLEANEDERKKIAQRLDIPAVCSLTGSISLTPVNDGVNLAGVLNAVLERTCSVSLEPMQETVDETLEVLFSRDFVEDRDGDDILLDGDPVEPLEGDAIDIADFLVQQLALAMDPWPRKTDARSLAEDFGKSGESSPFSVLKGAFEDTPEEN